MPSAGLFKWLKPKTFTAFSQVYVDIYTLVEFLLPI